MNTHVNNPDTFGRPNARRSEWYIDAVRIGRGAHSYEWPLRPTSKISRETFDGMLSIHNLSKQEITDVVLNSAVEGDTRVLFDPLMKHDEITGRTISASELTDGRTLELKWKDQAKVTHAKTVALPEDAAERRGIAIVIQSPDTVELK